MQKNKHLYSFIYDNTEKDLCQLESKYLFGKVEKDKVLISNIAIEPSSSAFIQRRLDIVTASEDYATLIAQIKQENIHIEDFKVEYLVFNGDPTKYAQRLSKLKDIGYSITGNPDYKDPTVIYAVGCYEGVWYFGVSIKNGFEWEKHKQKPHSFSNSINLSIAKALVNIASQGNQARKLLDACCGVGTIMLEACFAGYPIEGSDINWKMCRNARANLAHFNYQTTVYRSDIQDIEQRYDAAIIDLPYNLFSTATDDDLAHIIQASARIADRLVIVSVSDISDLIASAGFVVIDHCSVSKKGKSRFVRRVWVCGKSNLV